MHRRQLPGPSSSASASPVTDSGASPDEPQRVPGDPAPRPLSTSTAPPATIDVQSGGRRQPAGLARAERGDPQRRVRRWPGDHRVRGAGRRPPAASRRPRSPTSRGALLHSSADRPARRAAPTSGRSAPAPRALRIQPEGVVALSVHDAGAGAHPLREPAVHDAGVAPGVLVHQGARQHPGDDLGVAVRMVGDSRCPERTRSSLCTSSAPNADVARVVVLAEGEAVPGVGPVGERAESPRSPVHLDPRLVHPASIAGSVRGCALGSVGGRLVRCARKRPRNPAPDDRLVRCARRRPDSASRGGRLVRCARKRPWISALA